MDIHRLKIFASVLKNKSFSRASEELHLSQPTVSEHIKSLEEALGVKLFDRFGRGISPTSEAVILYPRALEIIEKTEALKDIVDLSAEKPRGELVLGASTIPGTYIIPAAAAAFKSLHPEVSFKILIEDSARIARMVFEHELLLGVVGARMSERGIDYHPFVEDELVLVGPGARIPSRTISLEELLAIPFILREEGSGTRKTFEQHLREKDISLRRLSVVAVLGSTASVKEAVKAGLGISILSRMAVREELRGGVLTEILVPGMSMARSFFIICRKAKSLPQTYRLFLEFLENRH